MKKNVPESKIHKMRVGAVSYLNTKPLVYGLELGMMNDMIDLSANYPSSIASALINDEVDIALLPVAVIPEMKEYHVIGNHCISCNGAVASVCLFSEVPLEEISHILLDYQSRTSVQLLQILCKDFWGISPEFRQATEGFESAVNVTTAALIIGDRALTKQNENKFVYDLGQAWKEYTGLPFVFALWVSNKPLSDDFIREFAIANAYGLNNISQVVLANPSNIDLHKYYTQNIQYVFDIDKKKGLEAFLAKLAPGFNLKIDE